jgi:hypothetical protein
VKFRNTLAVAVLFAALGAYLWWVERPKLALEGKTPTVFADVKVEDVSRVSLTYPDRTIEAVRTGAGWRLQKPIEVGGDETTIENLVRAVAELELKRKIEGEREALEVYGLDPPAVIVTIELSNGRTMPSIRVGKTSPVGWSTFVQIEGNDEITLVPSAFWYGMKKEVADLRDKTILDFDDAEVERLVIAGGERGVELFRAGESWRIGGSEGPPAEASEVRAYLSTLRSLRAEGFVDSPDPLSDYGLDEPRRRIRLDLGKKGTQELLVGIERAHGEKDALFVKRADGETAFAVGTWAWASLDKPSATFRDKTVLAVDRDAVRRVEVARRGEPPFVLVRAPAEPEAKGEANDGGSWMIEGETRSRSVEIGELVADLRALKGYEIAAETPTDLAAFGLDDPELTFVLRGENGEELGKILASREEGEEEAEIRTFAMADRGAAVLRIRDYVYSHLDKSRTDLVETEDAEDESADAREDAPAD